MAAAAVGQALLALGRLAGFEIWGSARDKDAALAANCASPFDYQREDFTRSSAMPSVIISNPPG
jgi:NADPH:quinone reductase